MIYEFEQGSQHEIVVPLSRNGEAVNASSLSGMEYRLYTADKTQLVLTKSLGSGIAITDTDELTITLTSAETAALRGKYYHQLRVEDPVKGWRRAFKGEIKFTATELA